MSPLICAKSWRPSSPETQGTRVGTGQISGHTESPTAIEVVVRPWSEAETFRLHFRLPVLA